MYGMDCEEVDESTEMLPDWETSMASAADALSDAAWWMEIGRYNPEAISTGTLLECWGDPTDPTVGISDETGGDCDNSDADAHRDNPEGPDDLVGLFLGQPADCDTCLDGVDNNCDGNIDCEDAACGRCFIGQGIGCGEDSACTSAGCASQARRTLPPALMMVFLVLVTRIRRVA